MKMIRTDTFHCLIKRLRNKLIVCIALLCALTAVFNGTGSQAAEIVLKDIQGHWAQADIDRAVGAGYIEGYPDSTFKPDQMVTRAEFITMLNAAFGVPEDGTESDFEDVRDSDWFAQSIWSAVSAGYMGDIYKSNVLNPNLPIPRQEAAALTANLAEIAPGPEEMVFIDKSQIAEWARRQVDALVFTGIIDGYPDGSFRPHGKLTRAEAVALINRTVIYDESGKVSASLKVTGSIVNIRSGPDTSYGVLTRVSEGDILEASLLSPDGWYRVAADGIAGWITGTYVSAVHPDEGESDPPDRGGDLSDRGGDIDRGEDEDRGDEPNDEETDEDRGGGQDDEETDEENDGGGPIVIDAGHGGYDNGATGPSGIHEKDITLAVALKLADFLKNAGYNVLLTRSDDTYIPLADRSLIANHAKAEIFVSIHCNASEDHDGHGTEVYTEPAASNPVYKQQEDSRKLAVLAQNELINALGLTDRGIKEKNLSVCRETDAPAILIELAFIDNAEEELLLSDPSSQEKAAAAVKQAIDRYFSEAAVQR